METYSQTEQQTENAVRSRRNGTYVENVVEDRLKSVMNIKHVLLPWLEMHAMRDEHVM